MQKLEKDAPYKSDKLRDPEIILKAKGSRNYQTKYYHMMKVCNICFYHLWLCYLRPNTCVLSSFTSYPISFLPLLLLCLYVC